MKETKTKVFDVSKVNWQNSNLFPKELIIDTNAIIDALTKRNKGYEIEQYLEELKNNGSNFFWYPRIEDELFDFFHVDEYFNKAKRDGFRNKSGYFDWKAAENQVSTAEAAIISDKVSQRFDQTIAYLTDKNGLCIPAEEADYKPLARKIYSSYGGNRKDAEHVAFANEIGVNNIITQDTSNGNGFLRYPSLNIFGNSTVIKNNYSAENSLNSFTDYSEILK